MIRYLTLREVLELYQRVMEIGSGAQGIRDLQALQSSIAQPRMMLSGYHPANKLSNNKNMMEMDCLESIGDDGQTGDHWSADYGVAHFPKAGHRYDDRRPSGSTSPLAKA